LRAGGPAYHRRAIDVVQLGGEALLKPCRGCGKVLEEIRNGSWASFSKVLFEGAKKFHARVASNTAGGTMEVHLDSLDGPLAARLSVPNTGGWQKWVNVHAPLADVTGEHTIYLRFLGDSGNLFNLQSFDLTPAKLFAGQRNAATQVT
jgi:hypothetical protein